MIHYKVLFDQDVTCGGSLNWKQYQIIIDEGWDRIRLPYDSEKIALLKHIAKTKTRIRVEMRSWALKLVKETVRADIHELSWNDDFIYVWLEFKGKYLNKLEKFLGCFY